METQYEIIDGRTNEPMTIEQRLREAQTGEEVKRLLTFGNGCRPSGATRRRWLRAAAETYERLRASRASEASMERNAAGDETSREADKSSESLAVSSENSEKTEETL